MIKLLFIFILITLIPLKNNAGQAVVTCRQNGKACREKHRGSSNAPRQFQAYAVYRHLCRSVSATAFQGIERLIDLMITRPHTCHLLISLPCSLYYHMHADSAILAYSNAIMLNINTQQLSIFNGFQVITPT
jgi:hypothetical protein